MDELLPYHCIGVSGYSDPVQNLIAMNYGFNAELRIVEVGVWLGATLIHLARLLPHATFLAVDTFEGSPELMQSPQIEEIPHLQQQFESNLVHMGVRERVTVRALSSVDAAKQVEHNSFDLVLLDANHSAESVIADCLAWWPIVKPGGFLCGDDYQCPSVQEGVTQSGLPLYGRDGFWWGKK